MARKVTEWPSNPGRLPKSCHRMAAKGIQFLWRWDGGTISPKLDVIWGMSDKTLEVGLNMIVLRKMVPALLTIASLLVGPSYVHARQWKPEPWELAKEYCSIKHTPRPNEKISLKWYSPQTQPPSKQALRETYEMYILIVNTNYIPVNRLYNLT